MDDKTYSILWALAAKLNVAVDVLWAALLRQALIEGATYFALLAGFTACFALWLRLLRKKLTVPPKTRDDPYPKAEWREERAILSVGATVFAVGLYVVYLGYLPTAIGALFNAEYWALKQLIK